MILTLFNQEQAIILVQLLIAHILADFFLQPTSWVEEKRSKGLRSWAFYKHGLVIATTTWIAINHHLTIAIIITFAHLIIDIIKIKLDRDNDLKFFLGDQILHLLTIVIAWLYIISGWSRMAEVTIGIWSSFQIMTVVLGYLICMGPSSYIVKFTARNFSTLGNAGNVVNGGRLIGIFERIIIYTLVLLNQYEAIGFLITGKSILRFTDREKKETEYVLVGTMLSYALAITIGVLSKLLISSCVVPS